VKEDYPGESFKEDKMKHDNSYTSGMLPRILLPVPVVKSESGDVYLLFKTSFGEIAELTFMHDGRIHVVCDITCLDRLPGIIREHYDEEAVCTSGDKKAMSFTIAATQGLDVFKKLQEKSCECSPYGFFISRK